MFGVSLNWTATHVVSETEVGVDDPEAAMMRVLYDEHAGALWRYALRLTGDAARAEDVVQETLLRAWRHPEVSADPDNSDEPAKTADGQARPRADADVRPEMRASPRRDDENPRHEEDIDEPGYGHGV